MLDTRVYLVTDEPSRYTGDWLENIEAAIQGGVTCVQYRDTENSCPVQYERILKLQDVLKLSSTPLIVNNDYELAVATKAAGVHVGQSDAPPSMVRKAVGGKMDIGYSITAPRDLVVRSAELPFVDTLGIGPIFDATATKADAAKAMGLTTLSEIVANTQSYNNCAIGGITLNNAASIIKAGARGIALVSAFSKADDPYAVAKQLINLY